MSLINLRLGAVLSLVIALAVACSEPLTAPDLAGAEIRGRVTQVNAGVGSFLVEQSPDASDASEPRGSKIWFGITPTTGIFAAQQDGSLKPVDPEAIHTGTLVAVWSTGLMLPSYPAQATASKVVILIER